MTLLYFHVFMVAYQFPVPQKVQCMVVNFFPCSQALPRTLRGRREPGNETAEQPGQCNTIGETRLWVRVGQVLWSVVLLFGGVTVLFGPSGGILVSFPDPLVWERDQGYPSFVPRLSLRVLSILQARESQAGAGKGVSLSIIIWTQNAIIHHLSVHLPHYF